MEITCLSPQYDGPHLRGRQSSQRAQRLSFWPGFLRWENQTNSSVPRSGTIGALKSASYTEALLNPSSEAVVVEYNDDLPRERDSSLNRFPLSGNLVKDSEASVSSSEAGERLS